VWLLYYGRSDWSEGAGHVTVTSGAQPSPLAGVGGSRDADVTSVGRCKVTKSRWAGWLQLPTNYHRRRSASIFPDTLCACLLFFLFYALCPIGIESVSQPGEIVVLHPQRCPNLLRNGNYTEIVDLLPEKEKEAKKREMKGGKRKKKNVSQRRSMMLAVPMKPAEPNDSRKSSKREEKDACQVGL